MLSTILKVIPKMDSKDIQAMVDSLGSRFKKIAKGFGKGLIDTIKGGGFGDILGKAADRLLAPLKEVQEAIDKTLHSSDDIATMAEQFNTSSGKLFKLVQLGKATGIDQEQLFTLITKFQTAVAQAKINPEDQSVNSVKNFVGKKDTGDAFFDFISQLRKLTAEQRVLVEGQIFGEKQVNKVADFVQTDLDAVAKRIGIASVGSDIVSKKINKLAGLNDLTDELSAGQGFKDTLKKADLINETTVRDRAAQEQRSLDKENKRIASYDNLQTIATVAENVDAAIDGVVLKLGELSTKVIPAVEKIASKVEAFAQSPTMRGVFNMFGGKDK